MDIRTLPIGEIKPAAYNPRADLQPGDAEYEKLQKVIERFDLVEPLVWNQRTGNLVGGHQRLKVLRARGDTEVQVSVVDLSDAEEKALNVALNKVSGQWDEVMLVDLLREIDMSELDLTLTGFDEHELARMVASLAPDVIEDVVPELPQKPVTKPGDLYRLGEHRLLCGDCTRAEDVERLMAGSKAAMMFADPPWNVGIGDDSHPKSRRRKGLVNDNLSSEDFASFLDGFVSTVKPYITGDVYCVLGGAEWPVLHSILRAQGYHWSTTVIWSKNSFVLGRGKYHRRYEPIWYGWANGATSSFCGRRDLDDVWEVPRPHRSPEHATTKPVALVARALTNSSLPGALVLDPVLGSGSTLIAAEQLSRTCFGLEIDPAFCDCVVTRWQNLTGREAVRDVR